MQINLISGENGSRTHKDIIRPMFMRCICHICYFPNNIRQTNNHVNLHAHRGVQDATSEIFKSYLFANFSVFTDFHFALHPHRIVHFLTSGLLHHAVLVNVGGLEPPLTEPKSVVLPLHHTSFIGLSRLSELRNLRVQLVLHACPSVRWYESLRFVLWAGLEPA